MASEPLSPAFSGEWSSDEFRCAGPRVAISKTGITATGMPIEGLSFSRVETSGTRARLVMELSSAAQLAYKAVPAAQRKGMDLSEMEVSATLIVSGDRITPTNVLFRKQADAPCPGGAS